MYNASGTVQFCERIQIRLSRRSNPKRTRRSLWCAEIYNYSPEASSGSQSSRQTLFQRPISHYSNEKYYGDRWYLIAFIGFLWLIAFRKDRNFRNLWAKLFNNHQKSLKSNDWLIFYSVSKKWKFPSKKFLRSACKEARFRENFNQT
jgi:hypothetical protein